MFAREVHHLRHFGLSHFVGENAAFADAVVMNVQHNSGRGFVILAEEALQDENHEFHRRVVVIEDQHSVKVGPLGLWFRPGDDRCARSTRFTPFPVIPGKPRRVKG